MFRFRFLLPLSVCVAFALALSGMAQAQERDRVATYFFGNSLVTHITASDETVVAHWLAQYALQSGKRFAADGQFGFLRDYARELPPTATWRFGKVRRNWRGGAQSFADADFDSVIITPENFMQRQPPDAPFDGTSDASPFSTARDVIAWLVEADPDLRIFIYGGWPEMAQSIPSFPPQFKDMPGYHAEALGRSLAWQMDLTTQLQEALPEANIALIPVGARLSQLLSQAPYNTIPPTELYTDQGPHGTPSIYALAAIVTYAALYGAPPEIESLPTTVHPLFRDNLPEVIATLTEPAPLLAPGSDVAEFRVAEATDPLASDEAGAAIAEQTDAALDAAPTTPDTAPANLLADAPAGPAAPGTLELTGPPGVGLANPALGLGTAGLRDWEPQQPFIDRMKTARPWIGHRGDAYGAVTFEDMAREGVLSPEGWLTRMPAGADLVETFILTEQSAEATSLAGRYVLTYEGQGDLEVTYQGRMVSRAPGRIVFDYTPSPDGLVSIRMREIDPADPIRNITVVHERHLDLHAAGAFFNPDYLAVVEDMRNIRFMPWMRTNDISQTAWDQRPVPRDFAFGWRGVPLEVMIALANHIGVDPWFTLPHAADDAYFEAFATMVRDRLDPRLVAYVEYSNEVWNFQFPQARWAREEAERRWGAGAPDDAWMQIAGARTAEMSEIWQRVFGASFEDRVKVVMAVQTGWKGLEQPQLTAPLWRQDVPDRKPPADYVQAYAVSGYFGYNLGTPGFAETLDSWLDASEEVARTEGEAQGLQRVALREFVTKNRFAEAITPATQDIFTKSLRQLVTDFWVYHAAQAEAAGLELIVYEGGTHVVGTDARVNDDRLTAFFEELNYTPEIARIYDTLMAGWLETGGTLFSAFTDVSRTSKWGSWGALRHLDDDNPRWRALERYNRTASPAYPARAEGTFLHGVTRRGGAEDDRLEGTVESDILIAGAGDDVLVSHGRGDMLHGGPGTDTAILPGAREMYVFRRATPSRVVGFGPHGPLLLTEIEQVTFEATAEASTDVDDLLTP
ncbi:calcium-binding protein [Pseudaestuariivita sp.]|uniref:calcium-binding protein n=1 Tax=Pseudaestuariivita sp. TaxID=2211669 RepID=UPI004058B63F